jgi:hypothetical protein
MSELLTFLTLFAGLMLARFALVVLLRLRERRRDERKLFHEVARKQGPFWM